MTECVYCDKKDVERCCMWLAYYQQTGLENWISDEFKTFKINHIRGLKK